MTEPFSITIYHNPQCGTSRNALGLIRNSGAEPELWLLTLLGTVGLVFIYRRRRAQAAS